MRRRSLMLGLVVALTGSLAMPSLADPVVGVFRDATEIDVAIGLLPLGTSGAASGLGDFAECLDGNPRIPRVTLSWVSGDSRAFAQRLDISKFREGLASGRFETTGRLAADLQALAVDTGETGINYYWRVLTQTPGAWVSSAVRRFEVPTCPLDMPAELPGS